VPDSTFTCQVAGFSTCAGDANRELAFLQIRRGAEREEKEGGGEGEWVRK